MTENKRNDFVWHVKQFHLIPYAWGGDDFSAQDCSGLMVEGFKSIGEFAETQDKNANGLLEYFKEKIIQKSGIKPGVLAFWINRTGVREGIATHVAAFINKYQIIHATGGGSSTNTIQEAIRRNAWVKIRSFERTVERRQGYQTFKLVDPFGG